jgi:hypothetical protein
MLPTPFAIFRIFADDKFLHFVVSCSVSEDARARMRSIAVSIPINLSDGMSVSEYSCSSAIMCERAMCMASRITASTLSVAARIQPSFFAKAFS